MRERLNHILTLATKRQAGQVLTTSVGSTIPGIENTDWLDLSVVAYLILPVILFLWGWFTPEVSIASIACLLLSIAPLTRTRINHLQFRAAPRVFVLSFLSAAVWVYLGGVGHFRYANTDWITRDAVLRDLVVSQWPIGYGQHLGHETLLRSTIAYFLPAAALSKLVGIKAAQMLLFIWTTLGAGIFFLQIFSLFPEGRRATAITVLAIVFFSGMDIVGSILRGGDEFLKSWRLDTHLEWWADDYQYSSMTTQLFWVPNHAIGGWLFVGMLLRNRRLTYGLMPATLAALILWSPLTAAGAFPFVVWRYVTCDWSPRALFVNYKFAWIGALLVSILIVGYVSIDPARIPKGIMSLSPLNLSRLLQFYLLEVGIVGWISYTLRPCMPVFVALVLLLFLPLVRLGEYNDFVMRASIPSLAVLAISVSAVLTDKFKAGWEKGAQYALIVFFLIGAVTPTEEIARSFTQPRWNPNNMINLVGSMCGDYWPHYIANLDGSVMRYLLPRPHVVPSGPWTPEICDTAPE
jgi:hypothetical protein